MELTVNHHLLPLNQEVYIREVLRQGAAAAVVTEAVAGLQAVVVTAPEAQDHRDPHLLPLPQEEEDKKK